MVKEKQALPEKQRQSLYYLAVGLRPVEIAERMGISDSAVRKNINNAKKKLNAKTQEQAIAIAVDAGILNAKD